MFSLFILPVVVMAPSPLKLECSECLDSDSLFLVNQNRLDAMRAWLVTYEELLAKQSEKLGQTDVEFGHKRTCRT